jgi:WD40 repeat protein
LSNVKYRAFVSFSHESDERLAVSLRTSLTRFAKPWYRVRTMRIFQDEASLSANPDLWRSIEQALAQTDYFLLMASPASAGSRWVQQEMSWWVKNRSLDKLIICLTGGAMIWDNSGGDFDWEKTTAIPRCLKGVLPKEPLYADFRAAKASGRLNDSDPDYRAALLDVAAPLMGRPKDELDGEDIRQHRRTLRTAVAGILVLAALGLIAGIALKTAHQRQQIAASRALASEAASPRDDRSLAILLSLESRRLWDTVESRRSLLAAIQRVPHAEAFLWGHTDAVTSAVFSPNGETVLSAGWDNRLFLWDASNHRLMGDPIKAPKGLVGVAFNPNGTQFAASASGAVVIWDTASRQPVGEPLNANEDFVRVAFSVSGKLLAASTAAYGAHPARIFVWDLATRRPIVEPIVGSHFAFGADEGMLAVARYEEVVLYDLHAHQAVGRPFRGPSKNISSIAFSDDGTMLAAGGEDDTIELWGVSSQRFLGKLAGHTAAVNSLRFDPSGKVLISGSMDGTVMRWDVENLAPIDTPIKDFGASISTILFRHDGQIKSLGLDKDRVVIFDVNNDPPLGRRIDAPNSGGSNVAFSPDGRFLATGGDFGDVVLRDVASGDVSGAPLSGHERQVSSLAYAPDGRLLVSGSMDGSLIFWDMATRTALGPPANAGPSPIWSLACSPDGKIVAASGDAQLTLWDLGTRKRVGPVYRTQKDRIWSLAFSPDGTLLASTGNSLQTALWKTAPQALIVRTLGNPAAKEDFELMPAGASFSPDGTTLAASTPGHSLTLWNVDRGQSLMPVIYGHTQTVSSVVFSADGETLASASADGSIRLWDVKTHELIGTLESQRNAVNHLALNPRSGVLASVGENDSLIIWDVDVKKWVDQACRIANRNLSAQEWKTYFGSSPYRKTCQDL